MSARAPVLVPELLTPRLRLRGHRADDHEAAFDLWTQPDIYRFILPDRPSRQDVWQRILRYSGLWDFFGFGYWAVEERSSGAYIGQLGFADFRRDLPQFDVRDPEAGWVIHPHWSGRGLATEGMTSACRWLDGCTEEARSFCLIDPANEVSRHLAGKLGYRFKGSTPFGERETHVLVRERPVPCDQRGTQTLPASTK